MRNSSSDTAFVKDIQARMEKKIRENEIETIEHWKERLERVAAMKPEGIASLQLEIKRISSMMENRISILKKEKK
ncbi:MAG: hypothetical protein PHU03_02140 [Syntrophales bacterium]|nr:hypothetical protein [Syntrophales bacterium]